MPVGSRTCAMMNGCMVVSMSRMQETGQPSTSIHWTLGHHAAARHTSCDDPQWGQLNCPACSRPSRRLAGTLTWLLHEPHVTCEATTQSTRLKKAKQEETACMCENPQEIRRVRLHRRGVALGVTVIEH